MHLFSGCLPSWGQYLWEVPPPPPHLHQSLLPRLGRGVSQIPVSVIRGMVVFLGEGQGQGALCGGAHLSARPCARCLAFIHYLISSSPHLFLSANWAELHREAALGPEMKLMLESGEERQVLVWGLPGCECSQVFEVFEPVVMPGKWERYPVFTHLLAGWRISDV